MREGATAAAALETPRQYEVDCVLLDLGPPDVDGLDLLTRLRQLDDHAVVVALTGRGDLETVVEAMKPGAEILGVARSMLYAKLQERGIVREGSERS